MGGSPQVSWDAQPAAPPQVSWDEQEKKEEPAKPLTFFQRLRQAALPTSLGDVVSRLTNPLSAAGVKREHMEAAADTLQKKQQESYDANLKTAAGGGRPGSSAPATAYGMGSSALRFGASAVEPKNAALGAAAMAAPEVVGPALVYHGTSQALENAPRALEGNPDAAERALSAGAEAAGGGAVAAGIPAGKPLPTEAMMRSAARATGGAAADIVQGRPPEFARPEASKALVQATQPGVNIPRATETIPRAGQRIQQMLQDGQLAKPDGSPIREIRSTGDLLDAVQAGKRNVWQAIEQRTGPVEALHADTSPIADAMEKSISKRTATQYPNAAEAIRARADTYRGTMSLADIEGAIQDANNDLRNYYKRASATDSPVSPDMAATESEVVGLRKLLDRKVQDLSGDSVADLKNEYGSLRDLERATAKQHAVASRTKQGGLWEGLAYLQAADALTSGGALTALKAAGSVTMGRMLRTLRDPNFLIEQSFHGPKAFTPAPGIAPAQGPPKPAGLLPAPAAPATPMPGPTSDTSGPVRGGRWTTPAGLLDERNITPSTFLREIPPERPVPKGFLEAARQSAKTPESSTPPAVGGEFAREEVRPLGSDLAPDRQLGTMGRGGVRSTPAAEIPQIAETLTPEKARLLMRMTADILGSGDRPGRYPVIEQREGNTHGNWSEINGWYGVNSIRHLMPWLQETDFTMTDLERSLKSFERSGKMNRVMQSAMDYVRREEGPKVREPGEDAEPYAPAQEPVEMSTDSNGIRWAKSGNYRVSVPGRIPEAEVETYAREKLEEQKRLHGKMMGKAETPF